MKKECDHHVRCLLTHLLLLFTVLLLFRSMVSSTHLPTYPPGSLCWSVFCYVKQWVTSLVHCFISQKYHVGGYFRHPELRFPSLPSRWGGLQIVFNSRNSLNTTPLGLVTILFFFFFTRCCPMESHASCSRPGSSPSVMRGRNIWTWQRERFHPWNLSTPASLSAVRIRQCMYTCLSELSVRTIKKSFQVFKITNFDHSAFWSTTTIFFRLSSEILHYPLHFRY